jgi:glycosyltransferase involved in cell wall biosynthesis
MKVTMASYQAVSILKGGPLTQLRRTAEHLKMQGVEVSFLPQWEEFRADEQDIVHVFAAGLGTYHLVRELHALGAATVVSPIMFSTHTAGFIRRGLRMTRLMQRAWPGLWTDYGMMADICRWARHIVPNSHAEADLVSRGLGVPPSKLTVVPNGVDDRFLRGDPSMFVGRYGVRDFVLNVGHIGHGRKNVLNLIRALAEIERPAVIIGRIISGAYGDACIREAKKHPHILLIDGLPHDSPMLASAYAACDTFVLPSLFETPGIAALEAGLAGAKIVITPHGGTKEYFADHAIYVDPSSVASIREGIRIALARPRGDRLRDLISSRYLWSQVASETKAVYEQVLAGGR